LPYYNHTLLVLVFRDEPVGNRNPYGIDVNNSESGHAATSDPPEIPGTGSFDEAWKKGQEENLPDGGIERVAHTLIDESKAKRIRKGLGKARSSPADTKPDYEAFPEAEDGETNCNSFVASVCGVTGNEFPFPDSEHPGWDEPLNWWEPANSGTQDESSSAPKKSVPSTPAKSDSQAPKTSGSARGQAG
jgi:hypothetical protein